MLKGLAPYVETSHALVVQWDGYVVNADAWTDDYLDVDYCGAPWPWGDDDRRVGNGGFSLRSRRLIDALASPEVVLRDNEDETIGVHARAWLEAERGIRYAPVDLASRFSFEVAYPAGRPFGFHGLFNFCRVVPEDEIAALAVQFSDAIARSPQCLSLMRNCASMGQWRAVHAIAARIVAADPTHAEAARMRDDAGRALERGPVVGRNDPCPCGSGKRYKLCHGALADAPPPRDDPDARARAGIAAHQAGRIDEAERAYEATLAIAPGHPYASHFLGVIEMQRSEWSSALPRLEHAVAARPDEPDFHGNLGLAYAAVDRLDEAVASHQRAIDLRPHARAYTNLGLALVEQHRHRDAIAAYDQALALDASFAQARWNRSLARLALGDRDAWSDYEARLDVQELGGDTAIPGVPRYRGGTLAGKTLLVDAEQGYGDMFQFVRLVRPLADRGARVVLRAQAPIAALMRSVPGVADVVGPDVLPPCDAWIPLMSIPGVLGSDPLGEAPDPPYIAADPARVAAIRSRLAAQGAALHVGVSWSGNPRMANNRRRSCPLAALAPLLARDDVAWYSLQREDGEDQIPAVPAARNLRLLDERNDFDGKAALIGALDLVVSVCTSTAHLAGALGRPLWVMLTHVPDWRWGLDGNTTRWYPTARLFRQPSLGDWASVVRDVGVALDESERA
jgi:tetratricopeptide (TPR) repeat protein